MTHKSKRPATRSYRWHRRPRPETLLLLLAFCITAAAKLVAVRAYQPTSLMTAWGSILVSDIAFFAAIAAIVAALYALRSDRLTRRCAVGLAAVVLVWSLANAIWLQVTGVQLQPGVVSVIFRHPADFWPTVRLHVARIPVAVLIVVVGALLLTAAWCIWRVVRPLPMSPNRRRYIRRAGVAVGVAAVGAVAPACGLPQIGMGSLGPVLNYSSHAHALEVVFIRSWQSSLNNHEARHVPRVGEREVRAPETDRAPRPNIVLLMLESISHATSSLGDPRRDTMPYLAGLAAEGAEFANTRVPVSQTGKAFWAVLLGSTPDIDHDYSEAILVDEPYEGLPSLLRGIGYRSAFFEMSRGSFECAPGVFANFAFDWAWFRENLEDPSADLGYLSGDDFRMLDPAFAWAAQDDQPFLLMMITSVAHDPYEVPQWFAPPQESDEERYAQSVEYTDAFVGEVQRRLEQLGLLENTLLCVLGDHGESLRPDSRHTRWVPYEEVLRVPWVIRWPGHVPAGLRCEWPCSQLDVTPTILRLLGFDISAAGFDGRDALTPGPPYRRLYFSSWFEGAPVGYIEGSRKWLYWPHSGDVFEYDLARDPAEQEPMPVLGPEQERVIATWRQWQADSFLVFDAKRFRKRFLFEHWWTFSSGRYGRAYYVP